MSNNVVRIADKAPDRALEAINRLTGLEWGRIPRSLMMPEREHSAIQDVKANSAARLKASRH
jgi:hypothetical protein